MKKSYSQPDYNPWPWRFMLWAIISIIAAVIFVCVAKGGPPLPDSNSLSLPYKTNGTYYFNVTCYDEIGLESPFTTELSWTNYQGGTNRLRHTLTFLWNPNSDPTVIGYHFYWGGDPHNYTNMADVGNVTNYTLVLIPPPKPPTNVWVFSHPKGLVASASIKGPWHSTNNPLSLTNWNPDIYIRGIGSTNIVTKTNLHL